MGCSSSNMKYNSTNSPRNNNKKIEYKIIDSKVNEKYNLSNNSNKKKFVFKTIEEVDSINEISQYSHRNTLPHKSQISNISHMYDVSHLSNITNNSKESQLGLASKNTNLSKKSQYVLIYNNILFFNKNLLQNISDKFDNLEKYMVYGYI